MSNEEKDNLSLKHFLLIIKEWFAYFTRKWLFLGILSIVGFTAGVVYAVSQKPQYEAVLRFALEDEKGSMGGLSGALGLASQFGFDLGGSAGGAFSGANIIELLKSRTVIQNALLRPVDSSGQSLIDLYIESTPWHEKLQGIHFRPGQSKFTIIQDSVMGLIYKELLNDGLNVGQKDKKVGIIDIKVKSNNQRFSKVFCEGLADVVSEFYVEIKTKKAAANVALLEKQTDSVRQQLNSAITGVAVAVDNTFNLNPALNVKRTVSQQRTVDVQANGAVLTELLKNLELSRLSLRKETPLIQVIDRPVYPLDKQKAGKARSAATGAIFFLFIGVVILIFRKVNADIGSVPLAA